MRDAARRTTRSIVTTTAVLALGLGTVPAHADTDPRADRPDSPGDTITEEIEAVVDSEIASAVIARHQDSATHWAGSAGVADLGREAPADPDGYFRAASNTKTFVATVIMQLVDEGRVDLDHPIENYLPGTVPDGDTVTVRQILNHTSGIHNYTSVPGFEIGTWRGDNRFTSYEPQELLDAAFANDPYFAPGEGWHYSNTNYILAGLLIEAVTGRPYAEEVTDRVLEPLNLEHTVFPGTDHRLPEPHATGYTLVDGEYVDATEYNPSIGWAAGEMTSTTADLARFLDALFDGELTSEESLDEMLDPVDTGSGYGYGLGLRSYELDCGTVWGHGGTEVAYVSMMTRSEDGDTAVIAGSLYRTDLAQPDLRERLLESAHCAG
ncbi:beta-lactamase family protein [Spiractinospora alimapuensis]|uniref:serine hydrolase domain-containing protein n=1 Tax=Spiractinospora alimapuensis TaxID=2820884 RepID=UPI001F45255A|nr:serine hydrolase domain-containing protein [Spiractinospora alimapuensis]QVQ50211.1 beta-lactamase family protein [Spiractinospora alimapuensis]